MDYSNKKIIFLGSSVTDGGGYSMCEHACETLGCKTVKWAVPGTTLADLDDRSYVSRLNYNIDKEDGCDLFICQLSTNDASRGVPIGDISESFSSEDFNTRTVVGAIEYIISRVREKYGSKIAFYTGTYFKKEHYRLMVEALGRIAEKWDIGLIDLYNDQNMLSISVADYWRFMNDPIHPSKLGYQEWWGPKFLDYYKNNL